MDKQKKMGLILVLAPIPTYIATILTTIFLAVASDTPETAEALGVSNLLFASTVLGVIEVFSLIGIFIGIPVGVVMLVTHGGKKKRKSSKKRK